MKPLLVGASVLTLSMALFGGGMVAATMMITAGEEPHRFTGLDTANLWTNEPVKVDVAAQDLERVPSDIPVAQATAAVVPAVQKLSGTEVAAHSPDAQGNEIDFTQTSAVEPTGEDQYQAEINAAHVAWCSDRYRSYSVEDNSYRPYSGGLRPCVSPYGNGEAMIPAAVSGAQSYEENAYDVAADEMPYGGDAEEQFSEQGYHEIRVIRDGQIRIIKASTAGDAQQEYAQWQHQQRCAEMYRSYRAEDNSYQPYNGGPRRQCE